MKNISLILNAVLFVAVAVLYYLHFSSSGNSVTNESPTNVSELKIAYINADSVLKYYEFFKVNKEKLESKGKKLDQDFRNRAQSLQNDINAYQRNVGSMTIGQAKAVEEDLGKKQQNLQLYQRSLEQEIMTDQSKMNEDLYAKITDYLKQYGQEKGLQAVLKYDPTSDLLYGGAGIDITKDVIAGLNEAYKAETAMPVSKTDTTATKK
ncbi:MAG: OmpH family outer membrane protein [Cyclobacteriaceae bacterium]|nr:OmpH family outer membrane protein [Cyclobacteriaceae bacterium]